MKRSELSHLPNEEMMCCGNDLSMRGSPTKDGTLKMSSYPLTTNRKSLMTGKEPMATMNDFAPIFFSGLLASSRGLPESRLPDVMSTVTLGTPDLAALKSWAAYSSALSMRRVFRK